MEPLQLAIDLARQAGAYQMAHCGKIVRLEMKGPTNPVTDVDQACEAMIVQGLRAHFPEHAILGEEGGALKGNDEYQWIIDPLDGTVNYLHGYPLFCVCIALLHRGRPECGVIFEPNHDELFVATRGGGATCNGTRLRVSTSDTLLQSLLATGFAYDRERGDLAMNVPCFNAMLLHARAVRRDGVAGVDLAYVAMGRFDGFWEYHLQPWDIAAGTLLVEEAGGRVTNMSGGPCDLFGTEILASNGVIHSVLSDVIQTARRGAA